MDTSSPSQQKTGSPDACRIVLEGLTGCIAPCTYMLYLVWQEGKTLVFHRDGSRSTGSSFVLAEITAEDFLFLWRSILACDPPSLVEAQDSMPATGGFRGTLTLDYTMEQDRVQKVIRIMGDPARETKLGGLFSALTRFAAGLFQPSD